MAKKKKGIIGRELERLADYTKEQLYLFTKWLVIKAFKIKKRILKNMMQQLKPDNIKFILRTREKFIFFPVTIFIISCLIYKTYNTDIFYFSFFGLVSYFYIKGALIAVQDYYRETVKKAKIAKLCKKYKYFCEMFDNRVHVVKEKPDTLTVYSSDFTAKNLFDKKELLESKFNRKISNISRQTGNFKYININFKVERKFKKYYKFQDYVATADTTNMKIPCLFGIKENGDLLVLDFARIKHLLLSGFTGYGKSNFLNSLIQSIFAYNNNTVSILTDFKYELEMNRYSNFRNCTVIGKPKDFSKVLQLLLDEMERRADILKLEDFQDISQYNSKYTDKKIPYILLVIDEVADLKLNKEINGKNDNTIINNLKKILSLGRALGICVIMATQTPSKDILDTDIRRLTPVKVSMNVGNAHETQRMTGVMNTQDLEQAEFMTNMKKHKDVYKSFLILKEKDEEERLPECNEIYLKLKELMIKDNEYLEKNKEKCVIKAGILHKQMSINPNDNNKNLWQLLNRLRELIQSKINKLKKFKPIVEPKPEIRHELWLEVKPFTNEVIECISRFKNLNSDNKNSLENNTSLRKSAYTDDINSTYRKFLKAIFQLKNKNNYLPLTNEINKKMNLNISKYDREKLVLRAYAEEFLNKNENDKYIININSDKWNKILN